uniref:C-type lectin domain-containing protein n=1 Tax=Erpetoichthys calabaricus TaxID=27687 RepID=A0A8C4RTQ9_ERPCA
MVTSGNGRIRIKLHIQNGKEISSVLLSILMARGMIQFVLINEKKNWSAAQNFCQVHYKDLVSIRNKNENEEILRNANGNSFWIGLFNNPWKWSDGGNLTFQNWDTNQPDNFDRNEACVEILKNGRWNDNNCKKHMNFSCFNNPKQCPFR